MLGCFWPRGGRAPRARQALKSTYGRLLSLRVTARNRLGFPLWSVLSRLRHGERRAVISHGHRLWVRTDDLRGYWISREGGTQRAVVETWRSLVDLSPDLAIDVGANYGEFSVVAAGRLPLIAIEANPVVCEELRRTLGDVATVLNKAASNVAGEMTLHVPVGYSGGSSLSPAVVGLVDQVRRGSSTVDIGVVTVDSLTEGAKSVILKIDVEGYDREVFEGAARTLARAPWWRAVVEFHAATIAERGESVQETWDTFARLPGAIIGDTPVTSLGELPRTPPRRANLLIGEGSP